MRPVSLNLAVLLVAIGLIAVCMPTASNADTVLAGWGPVRDHDGHRVRRSRVQRAVPLGNSYTFPATNPEGNPISPTNPNLGVTDTIIQRTMNVTAAPVGRGRRPW